MTSSSTDIGAVNDEERQLIQIVEEFLKGNDPTSVDNKEFRGARYDAGLAWVHFPKGEGGLGVRPNLQRVVERRMREA